MINVAILGFGVVGSGVAEVLTQNKGIIENKLGVEVNIKDCTFNVYYLIYKAFNLLILLITEIGFLFTP